MNPTDNVNQVEQTIPLDPKFTERNIKKPTKKLKFFYFFAYLLLLYTILGMIFFIVEKTGFIISHYISGYDLLENLSELQQNIVGLFYLPIFIFLFPFLLSRLGEEGPSGHIGWYGADSGVLIFLFIIFSISYLFTRKKAIEYPELKKSIIRKFIAGVILFSIFLILIFGVFALITSPNFLGFIVFSFPLFILLFLVFIFYLLDFLEIT